MSFRNEKREYRLPLSASCTSTEDKDVISFEVQMGQLQKKIGFLVVPSLGNQRRFGNGIYWKVRRNDQPEGEQ